MAGILNLARFHSPNYPAAINNSTKTPKRAIFNSSVRATLSDSSTSSTSATCNDEQASFTDPLPNFNAPDPKPFSPRPDKALDILGASLPLFFRLGTGAVVDGYSVSFVSPDEIPPDQYALEVSGYKVKETSKLGPRPEKPIELYEFEGCPYCRKVREIVAVLDLDVLFYPCPKNGPTFRPKVAEMGGKKQFPYMVCNPSPSLV